MPDLINPLTGRRYSRSQPDPARSHTRPAPAAPVLLDPAELVIPTELQAYWPTTETGEERAALALFRQRRQPSYDSLSSAAPQMPLTEQEVEQQRFLYRKAVAERARQREAAQDQARTLRRLASTCPWCQQPDALPVVPMPTGEWMLDSQSKHLLPVLGEVRCCASCLPLLHARAVRLLANEKLPAGRRGQLVDRAIDRHLAAST